MKRNVALLLLIIFSYNILGFYSIFHLRIYLIQNEMRELIESNECKNSIIEIIIPNSEISNITSINDEEIIYKNCFYDIIEKENLKDVTRFICLKDTKETELVSDFNKELKEKNEEKNKIKRILENEINLFVIELQLKMLIAISNQSNFHKPQTYISFIQGVLYPPPNLLG